eukprot:CAMPEP_0113676764 /NCGR_PEP_ID=MMETSP0038_2-20120614/8841_1 /TAXON_ID=2898 /ORGANISM="Cryptomonas paramecium" /LENGTH=228 /DNA_ID=CAMNT_0000593863 /DNA_START=232 /DNA_END=916 /DNA_ORIENTATION=+ /assembly_acc=CAM_ASM_000170
MNLLPFDKASDSSSSLVASRRILLPISWRGGEPAGAPPLEAATRLRICLELSSAQHQQPAARARLSSSPTCPGPPISVLGVFLSLEPLSLSSSAQLICISSKQPLIRQQAAAEQADRLEACRGSDSALGSRRFSKALEGSRSRAAASAAPPDRRSSLFEGTNQREPFRSSLCPRANLRQLVKIESSNSPRQHLVKQPQNQALDKPSRARHPNRLRQFLKPAHDAAAAA